MAGSNRAMNKKLVRHDLFSEIGEFLDSIPDSMKRAATEEYKKFLHLKMGNFQFLKISLKMYPNFIVYLVIGRFQPGTCIYLSVMSVVIFYTFIFLVYSLLYDFINLYVSSAAHRTCWILNFEYWGGVYRQLQWKTSNKYSKFDTSKSMSCQGH